MKRSILAIFLILGLFQGLWHDDREILLYRTSDKCASLKETTSSGEILSDPASALRFSQIFAAERQQIQQTPQYRLKLPEYSAKIRHTSLKRRQRRADDAVLPHEWGITILQFPRSDG